MPRGTTEVLSVSEKKKPLIPSRVMMVGESSLPQEVVAELSDHHMQIFMREPDPLEWPEEMRHLARYLPAEERIRFSATAIMVRHDSVLAHAVEEWATAVWEELGREIPITRENRLLLLDEMVRHVMEIVSASVNAPSSGDG